MVFSNVGEMLTGETPGVTDPGHVAVKPTAPAKVVDEELILVIAGLSFAVTWVAQSVGIDPVLSFIAAGFVVKNFTDAGEPLGRAVSTLSLPVYVVFFFIAGARIHMDAIAQMWAFALLLFAGRMGGLFAGTWAGVTLTGGPDALRRVGWMGFGAQAGIALSMALEAEHFFVHDIGLPLETLAVAGIAMNEMVGPILLKLSLGMADAIPGEDTGPEDGLTEERAAEAYSDPEGPPPWLEEPGREAFDPWGPGALVEDLHLLEASRGLRAELTAILRDIRQGPVSQRRASAHAYIGQLRRDFLRFHRNVTVASKHPDADAASLAATLRGQQSLLARRWETLLLDRAASTDFRAESDALDQLVTALDRMAFQLVETVVAPIEEGWLAPREGDGPRLRLARASARLASRSRTLTRVVEVLAIGRYHLSGRTPSRLGPLAGLMTTPERHLAARSRAIFESVERLVDAILAHEDFAPGRWRRLIEALRLEMEEEFRLAHDEVDRLADETLRAGASALGRGWRDFNVMIAIAGTAELPARAYRYSRVYDRRERSLQTLSAGIEGARDLTRGAAGALAMELQLSRLRNHTLRVMDDEVGTIEREVRGRLAHQLGRLREGLAETRAEVEALIGAGGDTEPLAEALREATAGLARLVEEALGAAEALRDGLKTEATIEPLRANLRAGVDELTDRFTVALGAPGLGGRGLPPPPQLREIAFRRVVREYLEVSSNRDLSAVLEALLSSVSAAVTGVGELQRGMTFNADLALAELGAAPGPLTPEAEGVLRETLLASLARMEGVVEELRVDASSVADKVGANLRGAVLRNLEDLQRLLVRGRWSEMRMRVAQEHLQRRRALLSGGVRSLPEVIRELRARLRGWLGEPASEALRSWLGLPDPETAEALGPRLFRLSPHRVEFPVAFQRLFSDTGLAAGDLLSGREREVARVRQILLGQSVGSSRAVAVIGEGGIGQSAVLGALVRGLSEQVPVVRHTLTQPVTDTAEVEQMLAAARGGVVIVEGLHWLFQMTPGGFAPLRRFLKGVLEDRGENAWLVSAQRPVWAYADRVVPLHDVFPEQVHLHILGVDELRRAVLARHGLSGFDARFSRPDATLLWRLREALLRKEQEAEAFERHFFERLHVACGGVLSDALRIWLASIDQLDPKESSMRVGGVPRTPLNALRRLPEPATMTLRQVARQGRLSVGEHALQFRLDAGESEAELARLSHWGILRLDPQGFYTFADGMEGMVYRVLRERRLLG